MITISQIYENNFFGVKFSQDKYEEDPDENKDCIIIDIRIKIIAI